MCINAHCQDDMLLVRALVLLLYIHHAAAQTCVVGQVVVNGACTYDDPQLLLWYKLDTENHWKNSGSAGSGADLPASSYDVQLTNTNAKRGTASHLLADKGFGRYFSPRIAGLTSTMTFSFWMYLSSPDICCGDVNIFKIVCEVLPFDEE